MCCFHCDYTTIYHLIIDLPMLLNFHIFFRVADCTSASEVNPKDNGKIDSFRPSDANMRQ